MDQELIQLFKTETFGFSCTSRVPCFTECCRDLNQFLTPYDVLRLKNSLGLSSAEFLEKYTDTHIGPETGLPVVVLKTTYENDHKCLFVTPSGCSVYPDRPSSCRTYPLVRMAVKNRETLETEERFYVLKEPHCKGFSEEKQQTVQEWITNQKLLPYNEMNDLLFEIISLKNRFLPGPMEKNGRDLFFLASYDLDVFRAQVFQHGLLKDFSADESLLEPAEKDDTALLEIGMDWLKWKLFEIYDKHIHRGQR